MNDTTPDISIVVEWENAVLSAQSRAIEMLNRVVRQAVELERRTEVLILFNPEQMDAGAAAAILENHVTGLQDPGIEVRLEAARGKHYYELKNFGAERARGELVVLIDSDVIPEPGWLHELVRPLLQDDEIQVVAGSVFIAPDDLLSRAFAVGWVFPMRPREAELRSDGRRFFASNAAFRRELLRKYPFPADKRTRGACAALAARLKSQGIAIWTNSAALVSHPAPNGVRHFVVRAMAEGRDLVFGWHGRGATMKHCSVLICRYGYSKLRKTLKVGIRHGSSVGLTRLKVSAALAVMSTYYALAVVGGWAACLLPGPMSRSLRV